MIIKIAAAYFLRGEKILGKDEPGFVHLAARDSNVQVPYPGLNIHMEPGEMGTRERQSCKIRKFVVPVLRIKVWWSTL